VNNRDRTESFADVVSALNSTSTNPIEVLKVGFFVQNISYAGQQRASAGFVGTGSTPLPRFGDNPSTSLPVSIAGGALQA
jgi:hypothetical protein